MYKIYVYLLAYDHKKKCVKLELKQLYAYLENPSKQNPKLSFLFGITLISTINYKNIIICTTNKFAK